MSVITYKTITVLCEEAKWDAEHYDSEDTELSEWYWNRLHMIESCINQLYHVYGQNPRVKDSVSTELLEDYGYEDIVEEINRIVEITDAELDALAEEWYEYQASKE